MASIKTCGKFVDPNRRHHDLHEHHYLYVSCTTGNATDLLNLPGTRLQTLATAIYRTRTTRGMRTESPSSIAYDMTDPEGHDYYGVGSTPDLHGYEFYGYAVRNRVVDPNNLVVGEIAMRKEVPHSHYPAILGALVASMLTEGNPAVNVRSRLPSRAGRQAMEMLGLSYNATTPQAGFYGLAEQIRPNLAFLGSNLWPVA